MRVDLPSRLPIKRIIERLKEFLNAEVSLGLAVAFAVAAAEEASVNPTLRDMARLVIRRAEAEPKEARRRAALSEMAVRLDAVRRMGREAEAAWRSLMREVEEAADPLEPLYRFVGGQPPRIRAEDPWRAVLAQLLKDAGGDPQRFKQIYWLRREGLLRAARNRRQREAVKYLDDVVDTRPEWAMKMAMGFLDGRLPTEPLPEDVEEARKRLDQWLEAARGALLNAWDYAKRHGVSLTDAVMLYSEPLMRFAKWWRRNRWLMEHVPEEALKAVQMAIDMVTLIEIIRRQPVGVEEYEYDEDDPNAVYLPPNHAAAHLSDLVRQFLSYYQNSAS